MQDGDKKQLDRVDLFKSRWNEPQADGRKLRDFVPPQLLTDVAEWMRDFPLAAKVEERRAEDTRQVEAALKVEEETYFLASEMSLAIQAATVRHPELRELLKPRLGGNAEAQGLNLLDMRKRLDEHAPAIKAAKVVVHLEPRHELPAIEAQLKRHESAGKTIRELRGKGDGTQERLDALRAAGRKLQTRINNFLRSHFEGDRAAQLAHGYTDRAAEKPKAKPKDKQQQDAATESAQAAEKGKTKKLKGKEKAQEQTKPQEKAPPQPGPVAAGQAGAVPPPAEASSKPALPPPPAEPPAEKSEKTA